MRGFLVSPLFKKIVNGLLTGVEHGDLIGNAGPAEVLFDEQRVTLIVLDQENNYRLLCSHKIALLSCPRSRE